VPQENGRNSSLMADDDLNSCDVTRLNVLQKLQTKRPSPRIATTALNRNWNWHLKLSTQLATANWQLPTFSGQSYFVLTKYLWPS